MPCERRTRHRFQASFRWMNSCIFWRLGFRKSSFHQYHAGLSVHRSIRLDTITDLLPGCCSLCFSTPGEASGPESSSEFFPAVPGIRRGASWRTMLLSPSGFPSRSAIRPRNLPSSPSRLGRGYNRAPRGAAAACEDVPLRLVSRGWTGPGLPSGMLRPR